MVTVAVGSVAPVFLIGNVEVALSMGCPSQEEGDVSVCCAQGSERGRPSADTCRAQETGRLSGTDGTGGG